MGQTGLKSQSRQWSPATAGNVSCRTSDDAAPSRRAGWRARRVVGERRLPLHHGGVAVGETELYELGAAGLRIPLGGQPVDRTVVDGVLVDAELDVALHGRAGRSRLPGLQVDDHDPALGVELQPVGVPVEADLLAALELDDGLEPAPRCRPACGDWPRATRGSGSGRPRCGRAHGRPTRGCGSGSAPTPRRRGRSARRGREPPHRWRPAARARAPAGRCSPTGWAAPAPPASRVRNHRVGQTITASTSRQRPAPARRDRGSARPSAWRRGCPTTRTGRPGDQRPAPHGLAGEPGQPARGRLAQRRGRLGVSESTPQLAHQPRQRQRPPRAALDPLDRHTELGQEPRGLLALVLGGGHRRHDQPTGLGCRRRRRAVAPPPAARGSCRGGSSSPLPIRSARSIVERRRRSGQPSSCTWATTTSSHSRPLERWAVSSRTASPRTPCSARVSAGICWASSLCRKSARLGAGDGCYVALLGLAGGRVEQRDDRIEVAVGPAGRSPAVVDGAAQALGPVGAGPEQPERLLHGAAVRERRGGGAQQPVQGPSTGPRRPRAVEDPVDHGPRTRSGDGSGSRPSAWATSFSRARSRRESRTSQASSPPRGPSSSGPRGRADVVGGLLVVVVEVHRGQGVEERRHRGSRTSGGRRRRHLDRHTRRPQRAAQSRDRRAPRAHQHGHRSHGTPSSRWARRSRSARCSASARSVS